MIRKYVNPRLAKYADVSPILRTIGVFGPRAHAVLASVLEKAGAPAQSVAALRGLAEYHHLAFDLAGASLFIARVPELGGEGFDCFVPVEAAELLWSRLLAVHATPVGRDATEIARVEAGRPLWGIDMDENVLAQEANFDALDGIVASRGATPARRRSRASTSAAMSTGACAACGARWLFRQARNFSREKDRSAR